MLSTGISAACATSARASAGGSIAASGATITSPIGSTTARLAGVSPQRPRCRVRSGLFADRLCRCGFCGAGAEAASRSGSAVAGFDDSRRLTPSDVAISSAAVVFSEVPVSPDASALRSDVDRCLRCVLRRPRIFVVAAALRCGGSSTGASSGLSSVADARRRGSVFGRSSSSRASSMSVRSILDDRCSAPRPRAAAARRSASRRSATGIWK